MAPGVVTRLRLAFLSVSLVLIGAMLLGSLQIKSLNEATDILTDASVPIFVQAQEIEHSLTELALLSRAVANVRRIDDLDPLKRAFADRLLILRRDIGQLMERQATSDVVTNMAGSLEKIESRVGRLLELRRDIILFDLTTRQAEEYLKDSQITARHALKRLASDTSLQMGDDAAGNPAASEHVEQVYARNLRQASAIGALTLEIDSVITSASRLRQISDAYDIVQIEKEILAKSDRISELIADLKASPARDALEEEMQAVRDHIFGDMGILEQVRRVQELYAIFDQVNSNENVSIQAISTSSTNLIRDTRARVEDASDLLGVAVNRVVVSLIGAGLVSMLVFGIANVLIVEKQINQRMSRLTKAVSAIAANETEHEIKVGGRDELAEMALALETFKSTAEELRRSNTELEKFAYVAAHDLRSPLRAIQDLAEWTVEDDENQFSEQGLENMELLQNRVRRLNLILTDLLAYSRVGKESEDLASISMKQIVESTGEMLDPNGNFKITYTGTHREVVTFATPLRQILLNLVSNSMKHHDRETGVIRISASVTNHRLKVVVQDDGPGIEPQYHDRIFGLFQTLRPRDDVEGSGLGLAIIRKLVEHYGGTIHLTSDPKLDRGSRFEFDMPEKSGAYHKQKIAA